MEKDQHAVHHRRQSLQRLRLQSGATAVDVAAPYQIDKTLRRLFAPFGPNGGVVSRINTTVSGRLEAFFQLLDFFTDRAIAGMIRDLFPRFACRRIISASLEEISLKRFPRSQEGDGRACRQTSWRELRLWRIRIGLLALNVTLT